MALFAGQNIEIAIEVPVDESEAAAIVGKVQAGDIRGIGKVPATHIDVGAIFLVTTEGAIFVQQPIQRLPPLLIDQGFLGAEVVHR